MSDAAEPNSPAPANPSAEAAVSAEGVATGNAADQAPSGPQPEASAQPEDQSVAEPSGTDEQPANATLSVEELVASLESVTAERDGHLDSLMRLQAEFENYRKAVAKRESDARERANEGLVAELLPILDACDGAIANGAADVSPIHASLVDALTKQGLERLDPTAAPFDPEQHEAVMHEPSDDGSGPVVSEVLRAGYQWKGRTLRAAMVRVKG